MMKASDLTEALLDPPREFRPVSFWFLNLFETEPRPTGLSGPVTVSF